MARKRSKEEIAVESGIAGAEGAALAGQHIQKTKARRARYALNHTQTFLGSDKFQAEYHSAKEAEYAEQGLKAMDSDLPEGFKQRQMKTAHKKSLEHAKLRKESDAWVAHGAHTLPKQRADLKRASRFTGRKTTAAIIGGSAVAFAGSDYYFRTRDGKRQKVHMPHQSRSKDKHPSVHAH